MMEFGRKASPVSYMEEELRRLPLCKVDRAMPAILAGKATPTEFACDHTVQSSFSVGQTGAEVLKAAVSGPLGTDSSSAGETVAGGVRFKEEPQYDDADAANRWHDVDAGMTWAGYDRRGKAGKWCGRGFFAGAGKYQEHLCDPSSVAKTT